MVAKNSTIEKTVDIATIYAKITFSRLEDCLFVRIDIK